MQANALMNLRSTDFIHSFVAGCERRRYVAKASIITQGDASQDLYFLIKGAATMRVMTASGRELVLSIAHGGAFFGEAGLFDNEATNASAVRAKSACEVARLSHARLRANPALLAGLLPVLAPQLAMRLDGLYRKTAEMAFYDTDRRVTSALRDLARGPDARPHPEGSAISVTRTELGSMIGASREAVGRALIRLQKTGVLRAKGRAMLVLDAPTAFPRESYSLPTQDYAARATAAPG